MTAFVGRCDTLEAQKKAYYAAAGIDPSQLRDQMIDQSESLACCCRVMQLLVDANKQKYKNSSSFELESFPKSKDGSHRRSADLMRSACP